MADLNDIINTLIAEANGEGQEGMRRVGETILNRAAVRGLSPAQVVRQPGQYTGFFAPGPAALAAQQDPKVRSAAEAAWELARQPGDPTGGADHYYNPSVVSPYWANSMQHTGDYGGHTFYSSRPVPTDALAALLTRTAPTPATASAAVRSLQAQNAARDALRASSMGTPSIADLYSGIFPQSDIRGVFGDDPGTPANGPVVATVPTVRAIPSLTTGVQQSYAAQDAIAPAIRSLFGGDPGTPADGPVVATVPTVRSIPSMPVGVPQSYAAQDAIAPVIRSIFGDDPGTRADGPVVATVPTTGVGQPPATRRVQSVPVPATAKRPAPLAVGTPPSYAAMDAAKPSRMDGVGAMPQFGDIAALLGPQVPAASGSINPNKDQTKLAENSAWTISEAERRALHGLDEPKVAPVPAPANQRPAAPKSNRVAITQPAPQQRVAPTPAPLSQRPAAAPARRAPAPQQRASSGVSGSGGGSAIAQAFDPAGTLRLSTNLYAYASDGNGGYSKVGTVRPVGVTPAQQYDWANALGAARAAASGAYSSDDARFNNGRGSGPNGALRPGDRSYDPNTNSWR